MLSQEVNIGYYNVMINQPVVNLQNIFVKLTLFPLFKHQIKINYKSARKLVGNIRRQAGYFFHQIVYYLILI